MVQSAQRYVESPVARARPRLRSLDLLRGLAVAGMVLVNAGGSPDHKLPGLAHAEWDGITAADLVFPTFLLVCGAALGVALRPRPGVHGVLVRRAAVLTAIGLALGAVPWPGLDELRLPGVLQRIALCLLLAGLVLLHLPVRRQVQLGVAVLAGYAALLVLAGPQGRAPGTHLPLVVDRALLGESHLYSAERGDPEGLATTPAAVVTVLLGAWAVRLLREHGPRACAVLGAGLGLSGGLLALVLPANKLLWTPTFVLLTGAVAVLALAVLSALADGSTRHVLGRPWEVLGRNALVAYVGSELTVMVLRTLPAPGGGTVRDLVFTRAFEPLAPPAVASLLYACAVLGLWWAVCAWLWHRRTFVTV